MLWFLCKRGVADSLTFSSAVVTNVLRIAYMYQPGGYYGKPTSFQLDQLSCPDMKLTIHQLLSVEQKCGTISTPPSTSSAPVYQCTNHSEREQANSSARSATGTSTLRQASPGSSAAAAEVEAETLAVPAAEARSSTRLPITMMVTVSTTTMVALGLITAWVTSDLFHPAAEEQEDSTPAIRPSNIHPPGNSCLRPAVSRTMLGRGGVMSRWTRAAFRSSYRRGILSPLRGVRGLRLCNGMR